MSSQNRKLSRILFEELEGRLLLTTAAQWIDHRTTAPPLQYAGTAVAVGGQLVLADAEDDNNSFDNAAIYDLATGQWSTHEFDHVLGAAVATVGDTAIFAGGSGAGTDSEEVPGSSHVDLYNADTGQWSSAQLSVPRLDITTATVGDIAIFAGGISGTDIIDTPLDAVDMYDADTGKWSTAALPIATAGQAVAVVDGKAFFAGGLRGDSQPPATPLSINVFDAASQQWSTITMPVHFDGSAATSAGDDALFADNSSNPYARVKSRAAVQIYDAVTDQWSMTTLSQRRSDFGTVTAGDEAIFAGGTYYTANGRGMYPSDVVDFFDAASGSWISGHMPLAMSPTSATVVGGDAVFVGTVAGGEDASYAEIYDSSTGTWSLLPMSTREFVYPQLLSAGAQIVVMNLEGGVPAMLPLDVFSQTPLAPPQGVYPASGSVNGPAPLVLRWTATSGATSYDVYVDGTLAGTATDNRFTLPRSSGVAGNHTYQVTGDVDGQTLRGLIVPYFVQGFSFRGRVQELTLGTVTQPEAKGTAEVTVRLDNLSAAPPSITVAVWALGDDNDYILGSETIAFKTAGIGAVLHLQMPVSVPKRAVTGATYRAGVVLTLHKFMYFSTANRSLLSVQKARNSPPLSLPSPG